MNKTLNKTLAFTLVFISACSSPGGRGDPSDAGGVTLDPLPDGVEEPCLERVWYLDQDGDGFGDPQAGRASCLWPLGYVQVGLDCNDDDARIHPGATEICNGIDDDCNGTIDDPSRLDQQTYYLDLDADGVGDSQKARMACRRPEGHVLVGGDCQDADPDIRPGLMEVCGDAKDNDCDGSPGLCVFPPVLGLVDADAILTRRERSAWWGNQVTLIPQNGDNAAAVAVATRLIEYNGGEPVPLLFVVPHPVGLIDLNPEMHPTLLVPAVGPDAGHALATTPTHLLVGRVASYEDNPERVSGVVYLHPSHWSGPRDISTDATTRWTGQDNAWPGAAVAWLGDVTGDGQDDIAVGDSFRFRDESNAGTGVVHIVAGPHIQSYGLDSAAALLHAEGAGDRVGHTVAALDDVNGDGIADLALSALHHDLPSLPDAGAVYVVHGPLQGSLSLADAPLKYLGTAAGQLAGATLSANNDARQLAVGTPFADEGAGRVWVVPTDLEGVFPLDEAGFTLRSTQPGSRFGHAISFDADINADGFNDLIVGAPLANGEVGSSRVPERGSVFIFFGPITGQLADVDADLILTGEAAIDWAGHSLASGVDLNADGVDDLVVGAPQSDRSGAADSGAAYVIFGRPGL